MMLMGIIWALLAPLSLLLPMWIIRKLLKNRRVIRHNAIAVLVVCLPVWLVWYLDYRDFRQVCQEQGLPKINRTAKADGFYLDDSTANSFGMRYLYDDGFQWMEAKSIYQRDAFVRYEISADRKISQTEQKNKTARFEVISEFTKPYPHTSVNFTRIIDTHAPAGAQELARSAMVNFDGGKMFAVLGVYGTSDFPSARSESETWKEAYYLVRNTLGTRK
jgi:hypothetical protein